MTTKIETKKPIIELKSIKWVKSMSQETPCYQAKVFVNGKHFADVENRGHGGGDDLSPSKNTNAKSFWNDVKQLEADIAETYPKWDMKEYGKDDEFPQTLEMICQTFLYENDERKYLTRLLKRKTVVLNAKGQIHEWTGAIDRVKAKLPADSKILNEMTADDAFKTFQKHAR